MRDGAEAGVETRSQGLLRRSGHSVMAPGADVGRDCLLGEEPTGIVRRKRLGHR